MNNSYGIGNGTQTPARFRLLQIYADDSAIEIDSHCRWQGGKRKENRRSSSSEATTYQVTADCECFTSAPGPETIVGRFSFASSFFLTGPDRAVGGRRSAAAVDPSLGE